MPKWMELVFDLRATTEDKYFVLDGGSRFAQGKEDPLLKNLFGKSSVSCQIFGSLHHSKKFQQLLRCFSLLQHHLHCAVQQNNPHTHPFQLLFSGGFFVNS